MTECRFAAMPTRMRGRPIDHRGFPVPWFVTEKTDDGLWDFTVVQQARIKEAVRRRVCFVSGEKLGTHVAFVVGPMCTINRIATDAPVIPEIGKWSAEVCPFLTRPLAKRPERADQGQGATPGIMVKSNPGLCAVWITRDYSFGRDRIFRFGDPTEVSWWANGALADAETIHERFAVSAANLEAVAMEDGWQAHAMFSAMKARALQYIPRKETTR